MVLDEQTLSLVVVALVVAVVVLAVWVAWLQRSEALLRQRLRRVLPEGQSGGIDEILERQLKRIDIDGGAALILASTPSTSCIASSRTSANARSRRSR